MVYENKSIKELEKLFDTSKDKINIENFID